MCDELTSKKTEHFYKPLSPFASFVRTRGAKFNDQPCQEALHGLRIAACLDKDIEHIAVGIYCAPEQMLYAFDRDHNLIKMPLVVQPRPVSSDAAGKKRGKTVNQETDCFSTHNPTTFGEQNLYISRTQRELMVSPHRLGDDFTRMTKALQERH